jgi:hypothetical protein
MQFDQAVFLLNFLLPSLEDEVKTTRMVIQAIPEDKRDHAPSPSRAAHSSWPGTGWPGSSGSWTASSTAGSRPMNRRCRPK